MKNRITLSALTAALLLAVAFPASARLYLGLDAMQWELESRAGTQWEDYAARGTVGIRLNRHLGFESRLASGGEDTAGGVDMKLDWALSTLVRPILPVGHATNFYALIGATGMNFRVNDRGDAAELAASYGLGVEGQIGRLTWVGAEYLVYSDKENYQVKAISINLRWQFD